MSAPYDSQIPPSIQPIHGRPNRAEVVDRGDSLGSALVIAARDGDTTTLEALLQAGVHIDGIGADGFAALHHAAAHGRTSAVAALLRRGASPRVRSVHCRTCTGTTPLLCAAAGGHADVVRQLLGAGADPDARDDAGFTSLHLAAAAGQTSVVKALLMSGATLEPTIGDVTPLDLARRGRHLQLVGLLRQLGAH
jgi:ankyrin repeat protein